MSHATLYFWGLTNFYRGKSAHAPAWAISFLILFRRISSPIAGIFVPFGYSLVDLPYFGGVRRRLFQRNNTLYRHFRTQSPTAVYEIASAPKEAADLFRPVRAAADYDSRRRLLGSAELPSGSRVDLKVARSGTIDQDRLNLPRSMAMQIDKVGGSLVSIRPEGSSANTNSPACVRFMVRISYCGYSARGYRSFFVRMGAFSRISPRDIPIRSIGRFPGATSRVVLYRGRYYPFPNHSCPDMT